MKKIIINDKEYILKRDYRDCFDLEEVKEKCTDYFDDYDYIFGDYAYDKLRLKGFYEENSPKVNNINNINLLENYIKEYCSYGARYFLLKKVK